MQSGTQSKPHNFLRIIMSNQIQFSDQLSGHFEIAAFGKKVVGLEVSTDTKQSLSKHLDSKDVSIATIYGIKIFGYCVKLRVPVTLILPGNGEKPDGCDDFSNDKEFLMWRIPKGTTIPSINLGSTSAEDIVAQSVNFDAKGISVYFEDLQESNGKLSGRAVINWEENLFGKRIVLIDRSIPFSITNRERIFEDSFEPIPFFKVKVYADVYFTLNPGRVCVELRATWPGGNVGDTKCQTF
jgi:hypothetical protein